MTAEQSPLLPKKTTDMTSQSAASTFELKTHHRRIRLDFITIALSLLLVCETLYGYIYYLSFKRQAITAHATHSNDINDPTDNTLPFDATALLTLCWNLFCLTGLKSVVSVLYLVMCRTSTLAYVITAFVYATVIVTLYRDAALLDNLTLSTLSFSTLHLTLPLLLTSFEWLMVHQLSSAHARHRAETAASKSTTASTNVITAHTLLVLMKPYFWPKGWSHRVRALSTFAILAISKGANLIAPLFMGRATQKLVTSGEITSILNDLLCYAALSLVAKIFKEIQSVVYLKVKQTAYIEIAEVTYRHIHSLSLDWHLTKRMGDVLRSMDRGVESANQVVSYLFLYLLPTMLESIVVIMIFALHFELAALAMIGFAGLVLYSIVTIHITLWRKKFREATTKHDNEFHDRATDCLINFETVKYFTNESYEVSLYTAAVAKYQTHSTNTAASLSLLNSTQQVIIQSTIFASLAVAAPHVLHQDHAMDVGAFVAITVYLMNLFAPLFFLGTIYNMVVKAYVDIQRLAELLNVLPDVVDLPEASTLVTTTTSGLALELRQVAFHYPSQSPDAGLKAISFNVPACSTTAIVGATGSGKTTLSRLLFRFYDLHAGSILINGQDIVTLTQRSLREAIGIVPQDTVLFNDTILHNIKYGRLNATMAQVEHAARQAQIYELIMSLPETWQSKVGERGLKLSGGEKQRIAIARTLLKNPPLVILDEATSALDAITEKQIQQALSYLHHNRTMLVIAHRLSTIRRADQIVVLDHGRLLDKGTHDELLKRCDSYRELCTAQLE